MLNMLPKLELGAHQQVLHDVAEGAAALEDRRRAARPGPARARMISAASLATSTAPATEMPTSAACSDGASLMPSPRKPTTWPRARRARRMRFFCAGRHAGEHASCARPRRPSAESVIRSSSSPSTTRPASRPTWRAHVARDQLVVAGQDLDRHAVPAQRARALRRTPPAAGRGRPAKPARVRSRSSADRVGAPAARTAAAGDGQHPVSLAASASEGGASRRGPRRPAGRLGAASTSMRAARQGRPRARPW